MLDFELLVTDNKRINVANLYYIIIGELFHNSKSYAHQRLLGNHFEYVLSDDLYQLTGIYKLTFDENIDCIENLCLYGNLDMILNYSLLKQFSVISKQKYSLHLLDGDIGYVSNRINSVTEFHLDTLYETTILNLDINRFLSSFPSSIDLKLTTYYLNRLLSKLDCPCPHNIILYCMSLRSEKSLDLSVCNYFNNVFLNCDFLILMPGDTLIELNKIISTIESFNINNFKFILSYDSNIDFILNNSKLSDEFKYSFISHLYNSN